MLKKYIEDINKDLYLDDFNLKEVQMRLPARKHFWVARLIEAKIKRNTLFAKKKKLKKDLVKKVIEAETAAERYDSVVTINNSIKEQDTIIEYLEKVEKILSTMHWEVKNIVDINRMEQL